MKTVMIQNADRNVSPRDYVALDGKLAVSTIFRTLQGEGPYAGRPAMFLRLAGCNYGSKTDFCNFCDTSFQLDRAMHYDIEELAEVLVNIQGYRKTDVLVITGGEPTLQYALLSLITKLWAAEAFAVIQLETNGTQPKFFAEAEQRGMVIPYGSPMFETVVSPKANERIKAYPRVADTTMRWASCFKFVLSADPESTHHTVPEWALNSNRIVYVSPMAVYKKPYAGEVSSIWDAELIDQEATAKNYAYAAAYALEHNLRLSIQMHLITAIA